MTDNKFRSEYRKTVDSTELPAEYKEKILSALKEDSIKSARVNKKPVTTYKWVTSLVAAVLVIAVSLGFVLAIKPWIPKGTEFKFRVSSAVNLCRVSGARIVFADSQGELLTDKSGEIVTAVTDENGEAIAFLPADKKYTAQISAQGFITLSEDAENGNFYISPEMTDDTYRAVLTWEEGCDLDAYLSITTESGVEKLHYFSSDIKDSQDKVIAALDVDNETGDGPETITFNITEDMLVRFSAGSYSSLKEENLMSFSDYQAQVALYKGDACIGVFSTDTEAQGNVWCVFEIENGNLQICDYIYSVSAMTEIK